MVDPQDAPPPPPQRMFTVKAVVAGLVGVVWIAAGAGFVDDTFRTTSYLTSNFFPFGVTAYLLLLVLGWNPLWLTLGKRVLGARAGRLAFGARELALVLAVSLAACWVPTSGLYRYFHRQNVLLWTQSMAASPNWRAPLETLPEKIWPDGLDGRHPDASPERRQQFERVYLGLVSGLGDLSTKGAASLWEWPWEAWLTNLKYWGPFILAFALATLALYLTVHRQWAHHEQLAYPLAKIYGAMIEREDRRVLPPFFREKTFWGALAFAFLFHAWRYASLWWPDLFPALQTGWTFNTWSLFADTHRSGAPSFNSGNLTFAVIGIAYFLSTEVGLTLGVAQFLLAIVCTQFYLGVGRPMMVEEMDGMRFGGYFAYALILLYAGRTWYWRIVKKAFGAGRPDEVDHDSVWAARMFVASFAAAWGVLAIMDMDWVLAGLYLTFLFGGLLVFTRLICETGLPFMQMGSLFVPFLRLMGYPAAGVRGSLYVGHLQQILSSDTREALQPYLATGLYAGERVGARPMRMAWAVGGALVVALAVGFWMRGHGYYRNGSATDIHANAVVPRSVMAEPLRITQRVRMGAQSEREPEGLARLAAIWPESGTFTPVAVGAVATASMAALRFRFTWFLLHPLLLLVWGTYPMWMTAHCFLIGWVVKNLILQFGGGKVYQRGKPFFVGLIMGEAAAMGLSLAAGFVYYAATHGDVPPMLWVYPG